MAEHRRRTGVSLCTRFLEQRGVARAHSGAEDDDHVRSRRVVGHGQLKAKVRICTVHCFIASSLSVDVPLRFGSPPVVILVVTAEYGSKCALNAKVCTNGVELAPPESGLGT